jgi:hypothetical protein
LALDAKHQLNSFLYLDAQIGIDLERSERSNSSIIGYYAPTQHEFSAAKLEELNNSLANTSQCQWHFNISINYQLM